MPNKTPDTITSIKKALSDGPMSISEIADKLKINWRTAEHYLRTLKELELVEEYEEKNSRVFFYKDKNNYFSLTIKNKDKKIIDSIYYNIKKYCLEQFNKEPTKTQAYKIIWNVNRKLNLNLPIGWYKYGPCCVQIYAGNETKDTDLDNKTITLIKESISEYAALDNITLQKKIYKDEKIDLYLIKEKLLETIDIKELNFILMDFIKNAPDETRDTVTDFARATLMLDWEKTRNYFEFVWQYITLVIFRDSLKFYYGENINKYLDEKIESNKKEAQTYIFNLVETYTDSKYSQDKLYQRWVKKKK